MPEMREEDKNIEATQLKQKRVLLKAGICVIGLIFACIAVSQCLANNLSPDNKDSVFEPAGRIDLPMMESLTGNHVEIKGFTQNLIADNRFVWLVIDQEEEGLSWPKSAVLKRNSSFSTTINATGHVNAFIVSLYAVDSRWNKKILNWLASDQSKGMALLPRNAKLHSIRLWNQKLDM